MQKTDSIDGDARGTRQEIDALKGKGLLQSEQEWEARNLELSGSLNGLIRKYCSYMTGCGLDVGCMLGELTDRYGRDIGLHWWGIDPDITEDRQSPLGAKLSHGFGHELAFTAGTFDCVTFANVYEHVPPTLRDATLSEIFRVLTPGGILVGQLPNPYFPIESHSRLLFLGVLPPRLQRWYWQFTPTGWDFDKAHFFSVSIRDLKRRAEACGFEVLEILDFNYSPAAIPKAVRWLAVLHARLGFMPWAWQFVFRKPHSGK
jgi:SAM-dependent methyltransferase